MDFQTELEQIVNNLYLVRFTNELDDLKGGSIVLDQDIKRERIEQLNIIIDKYNTESCVKKDSYLTKINKIVYKNSWNKLQNFHKIKKIEEYVDDNFMDKKYKEALKKELIKLVNANKISTKRHVNYDPKTEKIINIHVLQNVTNTSYNIVLIK